MVDTPLFNPIMLGKRAQRLRQSQKLSIEKLAKNTGLNKNTIVRFEKGLSTRLQTIYKICNALGTTPLHLIEGELIKGKDYILKKVQRDDAGQPVFKYISSDCRGNVFEEEGMQLEDIDFKLPGGQLNAVVIHVTGCSRRRNHPGEEFLFCLKGRLGLRIDDKTIELEKGDSLFFLGSEVHQYFNAGEEAEAVGLCSWIDAEHTYHHLNVLNEGAV